MAICLIIGGCGKSTTEQTVDVAEQKVDAGEYYDNTPLENFKTFTSITGIEVSGKEEVENAGTMYTYIFNNDADGMSAMLKFDTYLKEYGFVEGEADGQGMIFYEKDPYNLLISMTQPQESVIQYIVIVPKATVDEIKAASEERKAAEQDAMEQQQEEDYVKFVELCQNGKYQEAKDFFNETSLWYTDDEGYRRHYKDSRDYYNYCDGMLDYNAGFYGDALEEFSDCESSVLDMDTVSKKILDEISFLNGTYKNSGIDYAYYAISIDNGKVGADLDTNGKPSEIRYNWRVAKTTYNGKECWGFSGVGDMEYVISNINGTTLTVVKAPGASYDTFEGTYTKESSSPIREEKW